MLPVSRPRLSRKVRGSIAANLQPLCALYRQHRRPDWFEKYRTPATINGVYSKDEIEPIVECGLQLLDCYLENTAFATDVNDETQLQQIKAFQDKFREDIQTKDLGRKVLEKLTNDETAHRIFHEVAT